MAPAAATPAPNVCLREEMTNTEDKADLLLDGNNADGLLTRLRFGMEFKDGSSTITGGIRVSAGEAPNPASPFVRFGNGFRPVTFGLDQFYIDVAGYFIVEWFPEARFSGLVGETSLWACRTKRTVVQFAKFSQEAEP
jgi:hypothetical protein